MLEYFLISQFDYFTVCWKKSYKYFLENTISEISHKKQLLESFCYVRYSFQASMEVDAQIDVLYRILICFADS